MTVNSLQRLLALAGTLPFVFAALWPQVPVAGGHTAAELLRVYAVAIIAFVCGLQWQAASDWATARPLPVLVLSNLLTLAAWVACFMAGGALGWAVYAACFVALLAIDALLLGLAQARPAFFATRMMASVIVLLCLTVLACRQM